MRHWARSTPHVFEAEDGVEGVHELDADVDVHAVQRRQRGEARGLQPLGDRGGCIVEVVGRAKRTTPAKAKEL